MKKVVFFGGGSPLGFPISKEISKLESCEVTVVDFTTSFRKVFLTKKINFLGIDDFIKFNFNPNEFDQIIINLFDLFDYRTYKYSRENNNFLINFINRIMDIILKNHRSKISVIMNSYRYEKAITNYQVAFNLYNEIISSFLKIISNITLKKCQFILLPNVLLNSTNHNIGFIENVVNALKKGGKISVSESYRDYILFSDVNSLISKAILSESYVNFEFTSGVAHKMTYIYRQIANNLKLTSDIEVNRSEYNIVHYSQWNDFETDTEEIIICRDLNSLINEFLLNK
jgi:hypothetical protein